MADESLELSSGVVQVKESTRRTKEGKIEHVRAYIRHFLSMHEPHGKAFSASELGHGLVKNDAHYRSMAEAEIQKGVPGRHLLVAAHAAASKDFESEMEKASHTKEGRAALAHAKTANQRYRALQDHLAKKGITRKKKLGDHLMKTIHNTAHGLSAGDDGTVALSSDDPEIAAVVHEITVNHYLVEAEDRWR